MATPRLFTIPDELLLSLFDRLEIADKNALVRASRHLYKKLNPHLYLFNVCHENSSAMMWAAWEGRLGTMKLAYEAGADPNARLLCYPLQFLPKAFTASISQTMPPSAPDKLFFLPLHLASHHGHTDIVAWILSRDTQIDAECRGIRRYRDMLVAANVDPVARPSYKPGPVSWSPLHMAVCQGHMSTTELLIKRGHPTQPCTTYMGLSAMHSAAFHGRCDIMRLLAASDPSIVDSVDQKGRTAFHYAAFSPVGASICPVLAELGVDINHQDESGMTPLHMAIYLGNVHAAITMLDVGATIDTKRDQEQGLPFTPLHVVCCPSRRNSLMNTLFGYEEHYTSNSPPRCPWDERRQVLLQKILAQDGTDVNARVDFTRNSVGISGCTALQLAIRQPIRIMKVLLDAGAEPQPNAVHRFVESGQYDLDDDGDAKVLLLLEHGMRIDVRLPDYPGTLLEYICREQMVWFTGHHLLRLILTHVEIDVHSSREHLSQVALRHLELESRAGTMDLAPCAWLVEAGALIESEELKSWLRNTYNPRIARPETNAWLTRLFPNILSFQELLIWALASSQRLKYHTVSGHFSYTLQEDTVMRMLGQVKGPITTRDDTTGRTALHYTVLCGHLTATDYLLREGADPNATDNFGVTPLHALLAHGRAAPIEGEVYGLDVLLRHGADPFRVVAAPAPHMPEYSYRDDRHQHDVPEISPTQYTALEISLYHNRGTSQILKYASVADIPASRIPGFTLSCISFCLDRPSRLESLCELVLAWGRTDAAKRADVDRVMLVVLQALWDCLLALDGGRGGYSNSPSPDNNDNKSDGGPAVLVVVQELVVFMLWYFCRHTMDTSHAVDGVWACIARHMTSRHLSRRVHEEPTQLDEVLDRFFSLDALSLPGHVVPFPRPEDACRPREEFDEWVFDPPRSSSPPSWPASPGLLGNAAAAAELGESAEIAKATEMLRISQLRSEALAAFHRGFLDRVARVRGW